MKIPFSIFLLPIGLAGLLAGCLADAAHYAGDAIPPVRDEGTTQVLTASTSYGGPSEASLYAYDATWTTQDAERQTLSALAGRPVLLSMIFTSCAYACPMIVHEMKDLSAQLSPDVRRDVQFVLVSLDPEHDTPDAMQRFAKGHGLDPDRWTLLSGGADQVRMLAAMLGIRYRPQADGQVAHTSLIAILDDAGEIVYRQKGVGGPSETAAAALGELLTKSH